VTFDFSGGVKKDNWTFNVFLQNAFDTRGLLTRNTFCAIAFCSGSSRAFPVKPQFFGHGSARRSEPGRRTRCRRAPATLNDLVRRLIARGLRGDRSEARPASCDAPICRKRRNAEID